MHGRWPDTWGFKPNQIASSLTVICFLLWEVTQSCNSLEFALTLFVTTYRICSIDERKEAFLCIIRATLAKKPPMVHNLYPLINLWALIVDVFVSTAWLAFGLKHYLYLSQGQWVSLWWGGLGIMWRNVYLVWLMKRKRGMWNWLDTLQKVRIFLAKHYFVWKKKRKRKKRKEEK